MNDESPLLEIEDLQTWFYTDDGVGKAVDGVSYSIRQERPSVLSENRDAGNPSLR